MRLGLRIALAAAFIVALAIPSHAEVIVWHVPGYLGDPPSDDPFTTGILEEAGMRPGLLLDFHLAFDTEAPDLCESPEVGLYRATSLTLTWDGHAGASAEPFYIERHFSSLIGSCFFDPNYAMLLRASISGEDISFPLTVVMFWGGLPGDKLPLTPPEFGGSFFVSIRGALSPGWDGELAPATAVPEPATLLLVSSGLVVVTMRRRRRR